MHPAPKPVSTSPPAPKLRSGDPSVAKRARACPRAVRSQSPTRRSPPARTRFPRGRTIARATRPGGSGRAAPPAGRRSRTRWRTGRTRRRRCEADPSLPHRARRSHSGSAPSRRSRSRRRGRQAAPAPKRRSTRHPPAPAKGWKYPVEASSSPLGDHPAPVFPRCQGGAGEVGRSELGQRLNRRWSAARPSRRSTSSRSLGRSAARFIDRRSSIEANRMEADPTSTVLARPSRLR